MGGSTDTPDDRVVKRFVVRRSSVVFFVVSILGRLGGAVGLAK
jgi:hypothetical protein